MSEFHCLEIEFPNVDFSTYFIKTKTEVKQIHHAHLYTSQDEIELRIFLHRYREFLTRGKTTTKAF